MGRLLFLSLGRTDGVPHLQKQESQSADTLSLHAKEVILPLPAADLLPDVLVGEVGPARVTDMAVDDRDLSVVAMVHDHGVDRLVGVEFHASDAHGLQTSGVIPREHRIPHDTGLQDEVLHEDEFLGGTKVGQKPLPAPAAVGEIVGGGVLIGGEAAAVQIVGLARQIQILSARGGGGGRTLPFLAVGTEHFPALVQGTAESALGALTARNEEDDPTEQGEDQYGNDPRQLDLGVARAVDDEEHDGQADEVEEQGDGQVVGRQVENDTEEPGQLDGDGQTDQHHAGEELAEEFHDGLLSVFLGYPYYTRWL